MSAITTIDNDSKAVQQGGKTKRIPAFDFTKGMLVLFMVLYHWLNYFYGPRGDIYKYLRFLTPSFIFITGFLISYVHFSKYGVGSPKLAKRLFLRGVKLIGIFVALNILISPMAPNSFARDAFSGHLTWADLDAVFFTARLAGGDGSKSASFGILVPIGYLLMLAALLSLLCRYFKYCFHVVCALMVVWMNILLNVRGLESANLELVTVGLFGVALGYLPENQIQKLVSRKWIIAGVYCLYLTAITVWDVSLYVQMFGAILTTALIYTVGASVDSSRWAAAQLLLLGRYSLFAYISQIAILQLLSESLVHANRGYAILGASLVAGFVLTMLSVVAVDRGRARSKTLDSFYRAVFA